MYCNYVVIIWLDWRKDISDAYQWKIVPRDNNYVNKTKLARVLSLQIDNHLTKWLKSNSYSYVDSTTEN